MPGIYINDGGATSSALGNALGGLASAMSPENQARAALLKLQSEQADWQNRLLSSQVPATEQAAGGVPGLTSTFGANAQPPGSDGSGASDGSGSVAGAVANAAQPPALSPVGGPSARGVLNTSAFTPFQKYLANEVMAGRMSPEALSTSINLGQSATRGPTQTYTEQAARGRPATITAGQTLITNPMDANAPRISGPSEYGATAERTGGAADPTEAKKDVEDGASATANLGKAQQALALYNQYLAPEANPAGILSDEALKKLSATLGMNLTRLTPIADVRNQISSMFAGMVVNLRDSQGQPMFRGGLDQILSQFPDPQAEPARFKSALQALMTSLNRQSKDGQAALEYLKNPSPQAMVTLLQQKGQNAAEEGAAYANAGMKIGQAAGEAAGAGAGASGGGSGANADTGALAEAKATLAKVPKGFTPPQWRQRIIDHAKQKGIDLESMGF